ncbi:MAG: hypothetical protein EOM87_08245 [Clostridia bacterium]|nr:hypothetical protein [Clostridia bacterium]
MKKALLFKTLALALVLALCLTAFAACLTPPKGENDDTPYAIPENLDINVDIFSGNMLIGTITESTLEGLTQEIVTITSTNSAQVQTTVSYVSYAMNAIIAKLGITLPETITSVKTLTTDNYVSPFDITSLADSYLTIGLEEAGAFVEDTKLKNEVLQIQAPRFISDKNSALSNSVTKMVSKIVINPVEAYAIPENLTVNVEIYDNETLLGTVTNATLEAIFQQVVTMTTVKDEVETVSSYVCYSMIDILKKLNIALPGTITSVKAIATDNYEIVFDITSFSASYLTIGFEDDGEFAEDTKQKNSDIVVQAPRFISDKTSASSNSVIKYAAKIVINPAE